MKKSMLGAVIASVGITLSACGSASSEVNVTKESDGNYTAECTADCAVAEQGLSYTVRLKVTADADGTIVKVEDNGTSIPDGKDGAYKKAEALFEELAGKNAETVSDVDAVSGATASSETIVAAVEQGLEAIEAQAKQPDA